MNHKSFAQKMKSYTILYVEDDTEIRESITEFLKRYCKKIYSCNCSEKGMELYHKFHPDILLLDINLPGLSGIDFATKIRKYDTKTRIIISTAYTNHTFMLQAIELDITRYLVKPVTSQELFSAFEKCLNQLNFKAEVKLSPNIIYSKKTTAILKNGETIILRKKESELLEFFIANEGEVIRYEILEDSIWSDGVMTRDAIRSQIRNIRKKTGIELFKNISGIGYKFCTLTS
jgi:DNA-binding response OmpR family regulator